MNTYSIKEIVDDLRIKLTRLGCFVQYMSAEQLASFTKAKAVFQRGYFNNFKEFLNCYIVINTLFIQVCNNSMQISRCTAKTYNKDFYLISNTIAEIGHNRDKIADSTIFIRVPLVKSLVRLKRIEYYKNIINGKIYTQSKVHIKISNKGTTTRWELF